MISNGISHDEWALTHHGVKGMRWGVRKVRRAVGRVRTSIKTRMTAAKTKKAAVKKRATEDSGRINLSDYSTSELRSVVERLELENRYMRASSERAKMKKGSSKVDSALKTLGTLATVAENTKKLASAVSGLKSAVEGVSSNNNKKKK